jgi:HK97 gp10 family phage protein
MQPTIKIDGYNELSKLIDGLSASQSKSVVRSALRKASRPIILAARDKVGNYSKTLASSITVNYQSREGDTIGIGPKKKGRVIDKGDGVIDATNVKDPWFAHFVEFGVSGVGRFKKIGKKRYRADQPARPFMRPAFDEKKQEVVDNMAESFRIALQNFLKRKAKNVV